MKEYPEQHNQGIISLENQAMFEGKNIIKGDIGVQISKDGRIWVCIDGIAFIRFSPHPNGKMKKDVDVFDEDRPMPNHIHIGDNDQDVEEQK